jgi:hypothetical protein
VSPIAAAGSPSRFLTHPVEAIAELVTAVEPGLDAGAVADTVRDVTVHLGQQRRLAKALFEDPGLLTSRRPAGPPTIEQLIRALQPLGLVNLALPACGSCGRARPLPQRDHRGQRICGSCDTTRRTASAAVAACAGCGNARRVTYRDRAGRPLCRYCPPEPGADHTAEISLRIRRLNPGLAPEGLDKLIERAVPQPWQRRQLAWDLEARPELLTGAGTEGPTRLAALIEDLVEAGAHGIQPLGCAFCGQARRLRWRREQRLCCLVCYRAARKEACGRCGQLRDVASRDLDARPLCAHCTRGEPQNLGECSRCGRFRRLGNRSGEALCTTCNRGQMASCSRCGQEKPCYSAGTSAPVCPNCARWLRAEPCTRCGKQRQVAVRTEAGEPLCAQCIRRKEICVGCQTRKEVNARTEAGPLRGTCYAKDPVSFRECTTCGSLERLHHFGLCPRCACPGVLHGMLSRPGGTIRPELEPVITALLANEPVPLLLWLRGPAPRRVMAALAQGSGPVTHPELDDLTPAKSSQRLREVLVNAGLLPPRDEQLASLERWLKRALPRVADPAERRVVRSWVTWGHLRRLRSLARTRPLTRHQVANVCSEVARSIELLAWLTDQGSSLATARQALIDSWLTDSRKDACAFITWAVRHGYARDLTVPRRQSTITRSGLPAGDQRWILARRLLSDTSIETTDRAAGLLVLLYAQPLTRISQLTTSHVLPAAQGHVQLRLGAKPLDLPAPLAAIILELARNRRGHAVIGHTDDHSWLFPGGVPGRPLSAPRLAHRLKQLQIPPRASRNTALMELAAEMPAKVLSDLLGISVESAVSWTQEAGHTRPGYAAEIARRRS